jgi:exosortase/archaeosortase family protein
MVVSSESSKEINKYLVKLFLLYFFWLISDNWLSFNSDIFASVWNYFYHLFLSGVRFFSIFFIELFGYKIVSGYRSIAIIGTYGIVIGNHCVGFGISYGFSSLILAYPGSWKSKTWFIPLGILIIMLINAGRVAALVISGFRSGVIMQVEQHDFFNYIIYVIIFLMWLAWVKFILPVKALKN